MAKQVKVRKPHPVLHGIGLVLSAILLVAAMIGTYFLSTMSTIIDSFIGAPSGHYTETEIADTKRKRKLFLLMLKQRALFCFRTMITPCTECR